MISHLAKSASLRAAKVYFQMCSKWPVWFYWVNRKNRRLFRAHHPVLSSPAQRVVNDLNRDGIAIAHVDELFPSTHALFTQLQKYAQDRADRAETKTHKEFLRNLWDAVPVIDWQNPFVPFALNDAILATVNEYMQMCSYFFYLTLNVTAPVPQGAEAVQSQRWHGDPEDKKMCKVFLYLNDVDETAGPFTYVRGTHLGGRWRHLFREQPPRGFLPPSRPIEELVPSSDIARCVGRAGTIIFCDTSGYHKGGYAIAKERVMLTLGYCSKANAYPIRFHFAEGFWREADGINLNFAARHALTFAPGRIATRMFKIIKPHFKYGA